MQIQGPVHVWPQVQIEHTEEEKARFNSVRKNEQPRQEKLKHSQCWYYHPEEEIEKEKESGRQNRQQQKSMRDDPEKRLYPSMMPQRNGQMNHNRDQDDSKNWRQGMQQNLYSLERTVLNLVKEMGQLKTNQF